MNKEDLLKIIADDDFGLLNIKPRTLLVTSDERLVTSFLEINRFITENRREPELSKDVQMHERILFARLKGIRENKEKIKSLSDLDEHGLFQKIVKKVTSIDDIFEDDDLGIFESAAESIFDLKHVKKQYAIPDYIASRKPCKDFENFEEKFIQCQKDLSSGKRKILPFKNEPQIEKSFFFVLKGILVYIAEVGEHEIIAGRINPRLRCIFENGTEADLLLRSLASSLYKDGRRITIHEDHLLDGFFDITEDDEETGFVYVLKSLSQEPEIQRLENLYKIGFSRVPVEERIKNAENEPAYLMAPVSIVTAYQCFNMNPQKLEQLLHTFFGAACLNLDVFDKNGKRHMPREWFIASLDIVERAIHLVMNGEIIKYRYDFDKNEIIER